MNLQVLAEKLSLSRATISRALRNDERISSQTRQRVRTAAEEAGYRQNPYVSVLMSKLRHGVSPLASPVIAYINPQPTRDLWRLSEYLLCTYRGAAARAKELGFELQEFWLREPGMTSERLRTILRTRNIRAVILAPPLPGQTAEFLPEDCAVVACDIEPAGDRLHRVSTDYVGNTLKILHALRGLGYKRIGLAMEESRARYMHMLPRMALLDFEESLPKEDRTGYWIGGPDQMTEFADWMLRARPDALVTSNWLPQMWLQPLGFRIPEDIAIAQLEPVFYPFQYSGIDGRFEQVGRSAVDLLVAQIHANEFSLAHHPNHVLNAGVWRPGVTAPGRAANSPSAYDEFRLSLLGAAASGDHAQLRTLRSNLAEKVWKSRFSFPNKSKRDAWRPISIAASANAPWECPACPALRLGPLALPTMTGEHVYRGIPFDFAHETQRGGNSAILIHGARQQPESRPVRVPVYANVKALYFLHLAFFAWAQKPAGEYRLIFESGQAEVIELRPFFPPMEKDATATFQDSWSPYPQFESSAAKPAYLEASGEIDQGRFAYVLEAKNPRPAEKLVAIEFSAYPDSDTAILVAAVTALVV
ncbi:MAG TPA: LacI family DNA-binding transcriptional regulator [Opitutaceae bacterium]